MSRNPSASTHYFDPNTTDNLKYFMEDRDWPGGSVQDKMPDETQQTSARAQFGAALEAAATGREPGSPLHAVPAHHDAAETAIFERVLKEYSGDDAAENQSSVPVSMRSSVGNMIGDYASDVHQILGKKMDGPTDFNNLEVERGDLLRIMRGAAEDPKAFGVIHHSQSVVIAEGMNSFPADSYRKEDEELRAWVKQSASVLGHLDGVRGDVIYDLGQAEKDANGWNKMMNYHVIGAPLTAIPIMRRRAPALGRRRHGRVHERSQLEGRRGDPQEHGRPLRERREPDGRHDAQDGDGQGPHGGGAGREPRRVRGPSPGGCRELVPVRHRGRPEEDGAAVAVNKKYLVLPAVHVVAAAVVRAADKWMGR